MREGVYVYTQHESRKLTNYTVDKSLKRNNTQDSETSDNDTVDSHANER